MKEYFILASKNLRKRGIRSWLTLIGICIGIAAVISLISLGESLKTTINAQFNIGSTEVITVQAGGITGLGPPGTSVSNPLTEEDAIAISRISSVEYAVGRNIDTIMVEFNNKNVFLSTYSLPDNYHIKDIYEESDLKTEQGRLIYEGETGKLIIGNSLANKDKNGFNKEIKVNDKLIINNEDFRVVGILERKGSYLIDNIVLINERDIKRINNIEDEVDLINVKVRSNDLIDYTKEELEKLLRQRRDVKLGEEDFEVSTPESSLESVNQILTGIQIFIVIIASISILVGAIGIANTMTTSVLERTKEIGTMKAIGAKNKDIFYQFFVESGLLGLIGGVAGIILGLTLGYVGTVSLNNFLGVSVRLNINFMLIFFSLLISFLLGSISGIFPAMRAAKQNPVEAIRG